MATHVAIPARPAPARLQVRPSKQAGTGANPIATPISDTDARALIAACPFEKFAEVIRITKLPPKRQALFMVLSRGFTNAFVNPQPIAAMDVIPITATAVSLEIRALMRTFASTLQIKLRE